jgi:hypothetical protein
MDVFVWRYGWLLSFVTVAAAGLVASVLGVVNPLQAQLAQARQERIAESAQMAELALRPQTAPLAYTGASLDTLLPTVSDSDRHIQAIYSTADRYALQFTGSVLRTTDNPKAGISRTEITLPLRGSYPHLAEFVETLLREQPSLSVDQLRFRRDNVAVHEGEAVIRISCWMRSPSPERIEHAPSPGSE